MYYCTPCASACPCVLYALCVRVCAFARVCGPLRVDVCVRVCVCVYVRMCVEHAGARAPVCVRVCVRSRWLKTGAYLPVPTPQARGDAGEDRAPGALGPLGRAGAGPPVMPPPVSPGDCPAEGSAVGVRPDGEADDLAAAVQPQKTEKEKDLGGRERYEPRGEKGIVGEACYSRPGDADAPLFRPSPSTLDLLRPTPGHKGPSQTSTEAKLDIAATDIPSDGTGQLDSGGGTLSTHDSGYQGRFAHPLSPLAAPASVLPPDGPCLSELVLPEGVPTWSLDGADDFPSFGGPGSPCGSGLTNMIVMTDAGEDMLRRIMRRHSAFFYYGGVIIIVRTQITTTKGSLYGLHAQDVGLQQGGAVSLISRSDRNIWLRVDEKERAGAPTLSVCWADGVAAEKGELEEDGRITCQLTLRDGEGGKWKATEMKSSDLEGKSTFRALHGTLPDPVLLVVGRAVLSCDEQEKVLLDLLAGGLLTTLSCHPRQATGMPHIGSPGSA